MKPVPIITLMVATAAVIVAALPGGAGALQWERAAAMQGELWRWVTGHLVHFGADHLRWDVLVFLVFGSVAELTLTARYGTRGHGHLARVLACSAIAISVAIFVLQPQLGRYRGLSGLDSALFGWIAADVTLRAWRERHGLVLGMCGISLAAFAAKSIYELTTGSTVFVSDNSDAFVPVPLAHIVGIVSGLICRSVEGHGPSWPENARQKQRRQIKS